MERSTISEAYWLGRLIANKRAEAGELIEGKFGSVTEKKIKEKRLIEKHKNRMEEKTDCIITSILEAVGSENSESAVETPVEDKEEATPQSADDRVLVDTVIESME